MNSLYSSKNNILKCKSHFLISHLKLYKGFPLLLGQRLKSLTRSCLILPLLLSSAYIMPLSVSFVVLQPSLLSLTYTCNAPPTQPQKLCTHCSLFLEYYPHPVLFYFYISFIFQLKHHFHGENSLDHLSLHSTPCYPRLSQGSLYILRIPQVFSSQNMSKSRIIYIFLCFF